MQFDPTVTIEGAATALGVLGAATGYLVNLVRGWRYDYKEKRSTGTNLLIMDLLEKNTWTGLTESDLFALYGSPELEGKRREYKAWHPKKINRLEFERQLRALQYDHLIDLAGPDLYRIRVNPVSGYEVRDRQKASDATFVKSSVDQKKLVNFLREQVKSAKSPYDRGRALRLLARLRDEEFVRVSTTALDGTDAELGMQLADVFAEHMEHLADEQENQRIAAPNPGPQADG